MKRKSACDTRMSILACVYNLIPIIITIKANRLKTKPSKSVDSSGRGGEKWEKTKTKWQEDGVIQCVRVRPYLCDGIRVIGIVRCAIGIANNTCAQ